MVGDALCAQEAATILGNQYVVLYADAAKVTVCLDFVETQELFTVAALAPVVNEGRYKIDAWLVGNDKTLFQPAPHTQTVGAKLFEVGAGLVVKSDVYLS